MAELPILFPLQGKRVWVAGHRGMVGSALVRRLAAEECHLLTVDRAELDLRDQAATQKWLKTNRPEAIFLAAATVGGILANDTRPAEFIYDNLSIATNVIHAAMELQVPKLMFIGATCIYPKFAPQPMNEESLLQGPPEPTNEWYTVAKIAGVKLCQAFRKQYGSDFISTVPANLYGPADNFDPAASHVIPSLMFRAEKAKRDRAAELVIWGDGSPIREFMFVDDCADAMVFLMKSYSDSRLINVGTGTEISIAELARAVCDIVGFTGEIALDRGKPNGAPRKALDSTRIREMGWTPRTDLRQGLQETYQWFLQHRAPAA
jgi:GDP-L-fucose synthase